MRRELYKYNKEDQDTYVYIYIPIYIYLDDGINKFGIKLLLEKMKRN